jgi:hypothetical protein
VSTVNYRIQLVADSLSQGDQYASSGMVKFIELTKDMHPGIFVYSVRISDEPDSDQRAGWVRSSFARWRYLTIRSLAIVTNKSSKSQRKYPKLRSFKEDLMPSASRKVRELSSDPERIFIASRRSVPPRVCGEV